MAKARRDRQTAEIGALDILAAAKTVISTAPAKRDPGSKAAAKVQSALKRLLRSSDAVEKVIGSADVAQEGVSSAIEELESDVAPIGKGVIKALEEYTTGAAAAKKGTGSKEAIEKGIASAVEKFTSDLGALENSINSAIEAFNRNTGVVETATGSTTAAGPGIGGSADAERGISGTTAAENSVSGTIEEMPATETGTGNSAAAAKVTDSSAAVEEGFGSLKDYHERLIKCTAYQDAQALDPALRTLIEGTAAWRSYCIELAGAMAAKFDAHGVSKEGLAAYVKTMREENDLADLAELVTPEQLQKQLDLEERFEARIDRCLKRLMQVKVMKRMVELDSQPKTPPRLHLVRPAVVKR